MLLTKMLRSCVHVFPMDRKFFTIILDFKFRRVLNVVCFLLGNSPASEFYMPTFRNTQFHLQRQVGMNFIATCL